MQTLLHPGTKPFCYLRGTFPSYTPDFLHSLKIEPKVDWKRQLGHIVTYSARHYVHNPRRRHLGKLLCHKSEAGLRKVRTGGIRLLR